MKSFLMMLAVVILASTIIFSGCAEPAPAPAPAPAPSPTPAPAPTPAPTPAPAPPKVTELIFNHLVPEPSPLSQNFLAWQNKIVDLSGGRVKFINYFASTLIPSTETYKGVLAGVADITHYVVYPNYHPLHSCVSLPFLGLPSMRKSVPINEALFNKFPEIREEYKGVEVLALWPLPPCQIHTTKNAVKVPGDLKGIKIRIDTGDIEMAELVSMAGGVPMEVTIVEQYGAVERGLIEGIGDQFCVLQDFGVLPLLSYHTIFGKESGYSMRPMTILMNSDTWNKLPPDVQAIIKDTAPEMVNTNLTNDEGRIVEAMAFCEKEGHTLFYLTPEEIKLWTDLAAQVHEEWIAKMEAKGLPARAVYEEAKRLIAESTK